MIIKNEMNAFTIFDDVQWTCVLYPETPRSDGWMICCFLLLARSHTHCITIISKSVHYIDVILIVVFHECFHLKIIKMKNKHYIWQASTDFIAIGKQSPWTFFTEAWSGICSSTWVYLCKEARYMCTCMYHFWTGQQILRYIVLWRQADFKINLICTPVHDMRLYI